MIKFRLSSVDILFDMMLRTTKPDVCCMKNEIEQDKKPDVISTQELPSLHKLMLYIRE